MSIPYATAAPNNNTASPGCRPQRLPGRRSRKRLRHKQPNRRRPVALSPRNNTTGDAPTPTSPTTSARCRPKRIRRHHATARLEGVGSLLPLDSLLAWNAASGKRLPTHSMSPPRLHQQLASAPSLAYSPNWPAQPHEAPSPAARLNSLCRPVASQQHNKRRLNSKPPNNFGLLSPKTHEATPSDTRQRKDRPAAGPCR